MSSMDNREVYIPKDACIKNITVQCLPSSIARKMGIRPLPRDLERSVNGSCQMATWICPVHLRVKAASTFKMTPAQHFLTHGQFKLPIMSANSTASRIVMNFLSSVENILQASETDAPMNCSRVSSNGQNAMILYDGQIFLSVRQKKTLCGPSDLQNLALPLSSPEQTQSAEELRVLNSNQQGAVSPPQISSHSVKQPQEEHTCGTGADTMPRIMDKMEEKFSPDTWLDMDRRDPIQGLKKESDDGQPDSNGGNDEEAVGREIGCLSNEECNKESDAHVNDKPMENGMTSHLQADGDVGDDDQSIRAMSHLEDVNMNTVNYKEPNAANKSISISVQLQENMDTEIKLNTTADDVPFKTKEGCKINYQSLPAEAHRSDAHKFPVISNITSLAKDWNGGIGVMDDGLVCSSSEKTMNDNQNCEFQDGPLTMEASAQSTGHGAHIISSGSSLQSNRKELLLPHFFLENHGLDFEHLERKEKIRRLQNDLKKKEAKLHELNSHE